MAAELGVGYVSIVPETSKIAPGITKAIQGAEKGAGGQGRSIGSTLSAGISKTLKVGAASTGLSAGGVLGTAIYKGMGRLNAIEGARAKMGVLMKSAADVDTAMQNALASVNETAFGLGEAATTAAGLVAANVKPGQELEGVLKTVADTAAMAGSSMSDMGLIFGSVAARGKLQGDDMMQLLGRGVPVLQLLADETGKTAAEVSKMVSEGKIDFETFAHAMEKGVGGVAKAMGNTFQGSFANMHAALGRFGAALMEPVFTQAPRVFNALKETINVATEAVKPLAAAFGQLLEPIVAGFVAFLENRVNPAIKAWSESFADWLPKAAQEVKGFVDAVRGSPELHQAWDSLGNALSVIWDVLKDLGPELGQIGTTAANAAAQVSAETWKILGQALEIAAPLIRDIVQFLADHPGVVTAFFTAWAGSKALDQATQPLQGVASAVGQVARAVALAGIAKHLTELSAATKVTNPALSAFAGIGGNVARMMNPMGAAAKLVLHPMKGIARLVVKMVPRLLAFAGPWGILAGVIAGVGLALWGFFTRTETGRKLWKQFTEFVKEKWENLKESFQNGIDRIKGVFETLKGAWEEVKAVFAIGDHAGDTPILKALFGERGAGIITDIVKTFSRVRAAWVELKDAFTGGDSGYAALGSFFGEGTAEGIVDFVTQAGEAFESLKAIASSAADVLGTVFSGIADMAGTVLAAGWETIKLGAQAAWEGIQVGWENFKDTVSTVWGVIKDTLVTVWESIKTSVFTAWQVALDVVAGAISVFSAALKGDWSGVKDALKATWETIKSHVFEGMSKQLTLLKGWWDRTGQAISDLVGRLKERAMSFVEDIKARFFERVGTLLGELATKWENFKSQVIEKLSGLIAKCVSFVEDMKARFKEAIRKVLVGIVTHFSEMRQGAEEKTNAMVNFLKDIPNKIKAIFANAKNWLIQAGRDAINGFKQGLESAWQNAQSWASSRLHLSVGGMVPAHASGGLAGYTTGGRHGGYRLPLTGPGTHRTDGFMALDGGGMPLARLDAGEWVINRRSSEKYGRELAQINAGIFPKLPGYKDGGLIARTSREIKEALAPVASPYVFGGWGLGGTDCSGGVSMAVNAFRGLDILDSRTATGNEGAWLENKGFVRGAGGSGDFTVAYKNGGPGGGHTAAQLPDETFVESGGNTGQGLTVGGKAGPLVGRGFTDWYHAPGGDDDSSLSADISEGITDGLTRTALSSDPDGSSGGNSSVNWGAAAELHTAITKFYRLQSEVRPGSSAGRSPFGAGDPGLSDSNYDKAEKSWDGPDWGPGFFTHEVARAAKSLGLPEAAAVIGVATTLVESGNPLRMWANKAVPESLGFRHDAVGSDYDSIGLFQQRQAGWGTVAQRMTPFDSAIMFFERLKAFDWQSMDPGAAAQKVQVSAFPDRYGKQMGTAQSLLKTAGVYDTGGVLPHLGGAINLSGKPEIVINNDQLTAFSRLANNLGALIPVLEKTAFTGDFAPTAASTAAGLEEDDPLVEIAVQVHDTLRDLGGDIVSNTEVVRDAEKGLLETRRAVAKELKDVSAQEQEVADLRAELAKISAEDSGLSTAAARRLEDAEKRLARAREDAASSKNPAKAARKIADAEEKLARAREDAAKDLDKSGSKNAQKQKQLLDKIAKAEDKLAAAREKSTDAAKRLEAAERTVIAARGKAIQDMLGFVAQAFTNVTNAAQQVMQSIAELTATFEKSRDAVRQLNQQHVTDQLAAARAQRDMRTAEMGIAQAKAQGALNVAKAEAAAAEARKKLMDEMHLKGTTSLIDLGAALDRFTETGVFDIEDMTTAVTDTMTEGAAKAAQELLAAEETVKLQKIDAIRETYAAEDKYAQARWAALEATLKQAHTVDMLAAAQQRLNAQASSFYGMTSQGANRASRGWSGIGKIFSGGLKILGGVAAGVLSGGALLGPAIMAGVSGIKDLTEGIPAAVENFQDVKESWEKSDWKAKASMVGGMALQTVGSVGAGVYGVQTGDWSTATQIQAGVSEAGQSITQAPFNAAKERNARAESIYQERTQQLEADFQQRMALFNAERQKDEMARQDRMLVADYAKEFQQLQVTIAQAGTKEEAIAANELAKTAEARRDSMLELSRQSYDQLRNLTDVLRTDLEGTTARSARYAPTVHNITLQVPGDAVTVDTLNEAFAKVSEIADGQDVLSIRLQQLEHQPTSAPDYVGVRRGI